jgi:hypothetical protein
MPQHNVPPFETGAITKPRQLNRWLDKNPEGAGLQRVESFITLPVFNTTPTWNGHSDIVLTWNFVSPNNFSLTDISALPTNPNYILCIAYELSDIVYRYKLCGDDSLLDVQFTPYTNQPIKHNFRLEIWSLSALTVSEVSARTMYTSVLGSLDYRWGLDFELAGNTGVVTNFQNINSVIPVPTAGLFCHLTDATGLTYEAVFYHVTSWVDTIGGKTITPNPHASVTYPTVDRGKLFNSKHANSWSH